MKSNIDTEEEQRIETVHLHQFPHYTNRRFIDNAGTPENMKRAAQRLNDLGYDVRQVSKKLIIAVGGFK